MLRKKDFYLIFTGEKVILERQNSLSWNEFCKKKREQKTNKIGRKPVRKMEQMIREEIFSGFCRTCNQAQMVTCEFEQKGDRLELTEVDCGYRKCIHQSKLRDCKADPADGTGVIGRSRRENMLVRLNKKNTNIPCIWLLFFFVIA